MRKLKLLCLTDHRGHSSENSLYSILQTMISSDFFDQIDIASRGCNENKAFFFESVYSRLRGTHVNKSFKWTKDGSFFTGNLRDLEFSQYDVVFLRLPRPISDSFLLDLEALFNDKVIINKPSGIIETSNKKFLTELGPLCPLVKLCKTNKEIKDMLDLYPIVLKPLKEYGGKGIVKIDKRGVDTGNEIIDLEKYLNQIDSSLRDNPLLGMKFLKNVDKGDKRILVVNGKIMGASLRLPKEGSWLCNVAQGGSSVKAKPNQEEITLVEKLSPILLEKGILIYGMDTLEDDNGKRVLSEVNTLSIGGFKQIAEQDNSPILEELVQEIYNYVIEQ